MAIGRRPAGLLLLGLAIVLLALAQAAPAVAHATLLRSQPDDGATLSEAPKAFRLAFNEPVALMALRLSGGGRMVTLDRFSTDGATIEIEAPGALADGSYALSYRVVSEDGHPIAGALFFAVGAPGAGPPPEADPADPALEAAIWAARVVLYLGLLVGAGGAFARAWLGGGAPDGRRIAAVAAALGLAAAPVALALQGADLVGAPVSGALAAVALRAALSTSYAWTIGAAVASLALALLALSSRGMAASRASSALALAGVGIALAASGHASAAAPQGLMRVSVFVHGAAAAFWVGALVPLLADLRRGSTHMLERFSAAAPFAVAALALAGTVLAVRQLEGLPALWTTDYGLVLSAKLALVAVLVGLAAANRRRWTGRALAGEAGARRNLRRSIMAEIVVVAAILGLVALWRFTPPPRALAVQAGEPAVVHLQTLAAQADVTISPGRAGRADATVTLLTGDFGPLDAKELTIVLSNPAAGVEPVRRAARKPGDGTWRIDALQIPAAGQWTIGVEILVTDYDLEKLEGQIEIRP